METSHDSMSLFLQMIVTVTWEAGDPVRSMPPSSAEASDASQLPVTSFSPEKTLFTKESKEHFEFGCKRGQML